MPLQAARHIAIVLFVWLIGAAAASAHETDQFTTPEGREFADVGQLLSRWHYKAIKNGVDRVNAEIKSAIDDHRSEADIRALQDPDNLVRAVNHAFPWAMDVIEGWDDLSRSQKMADEFPGYVVGYKQPLANIYQHTHFFLDPRQFFRVWLGATVKAYGHYIGADKIGHFTDEGMNYYNVWHKARRGGDDDLTAIRKAIFLGTDDFLLGEKGMLGLKTAGDYSNADLASNWLGFSFYRNLTEQWPLQGQMQPPMCVREGPYWKIAPHVRADSDFFAVFVCDHEDEALNPGQFESLMHRPLRASIRERREAILERYRDEHGCRRPKEWFDRKLDEFSTYYGGSYGHSGKYDQLISIGNTLFEPVLADANVNARDLSGQTSLHTAASSGNAELVRAMLARGADVNARVRSKEGHNSDWGSTPLHFATASGNVEVVQMLIGAGADVRATNDVGVTPLHRAIRSPQVAQLLLSRGAKVEMADARGRTALHWTACDSEDCRAVAGVLVDRGANVNAADHEGRTPLHLAAVGGREGIAAELLRRGADANAPDQFHVSPLHLAAAHRGLNPMVGALVSGGAKIDARDDFGCTALHDAARVGASETIAMLLRSGASPMVANAYGATPGVVARERGFDGVAALLHSDEGGARPAGGKFRP